MLKSNNFQRYIAVGTLCISSLIYTSFVESSTKENNVFNTNCEVILGQSSTSINLQHLISIQGKSLPIVAKHKLTSLTSEKGRLSIDDKGNNYSFLSYSISPPKKSFSKPLTKNDITDEPKITEFYVGEIYLSVGAGVNNEVCTYKYTYRSNGKRVIRGIPMVF